MKKKCKTDSEYHAEAFSSATLYRKLVKIVDVLHENFNFTHAILWHRSKVKYTLKATCALFFYMFFKVSNQNKKKDIDKISKSEKR